MKLKKKGKKVQLDDGAESDIMKTRITLSFSIIISLLIFLFGIVNVKVGRVTAGRAELISSTIMLIYTFYSLILRKKSRGPRRLLTVLVIAMGIYLYWNGGFGNTGIIWTLILPPLFFSLHSQRKGLILTLSFLIIIGLLFLLSSRGRIAVAYNGIETLAALLVHSCIGFILFSYERNRNLYKLQIATLEELLPICSHCKKILDDEGKWQPVDDYMHRKKDVSFSHGICPNCLKELYPDLVDSKGQLKK